MRVNNTSLRHQEVCVLPPMCSEAQLAHPAPVCGLSTGVVCLLLLILFALTRIHIHTHAQGNCLAHAHPNTPTHATNKQLAHTLPT